MKRMICVALVFFVTSKVSAQDPITDVIKAGIVKVIKAVDLKIQRLQNETIWLQNAQKALENTLSKVKLEEISGWVEKQKTLYQNYYDELWKVKDAVAYYHRVKDIYEKQSRMIRLYQQALRLAHEDTHFSAGEREHILLVYKNMLQEGVDAVGRLVMVVKAFVTDMHDASRLQVIDEVAVQIDDVYADMVKFNEENSMISLQRAKDERDAEQVKVLYGIDK